VEGRRKRRSRRESWEAHERMGIPLL